MAFRFRRSVKLGKGIRLNVSKRGVGMSVGKRGLRKSVHSTGRSTNSIGIPGTGLSYVKTQTVPKKQTSRNQGTHRSQKQLIGSAEGTEVVEAHDDYIYAITHLHLDSPKPIDWQEISVIPAPFHQEEVGPLESEALAAHKSYTPNFLERLIKSMATKQKERLNQAIQQARRQDFLDYEEWEQQVGLAESVVLGASEAYEQVIREHPDLDEVRKRGLSLRVPNSQTIEVEVHLTTDDVVPVDALSLTKTGKVSTRKMTKTDYYGIMKDFICGHTLWIARVLFAILPIDACVIHVCENALNTATGNHENHVLLSVSIDKQTFREFNLEHLNPSDAMTNFHHQMNHLKTKGFRPVERISE